MVYVEFLGPINRPTMELEATTLHEVAAALQSQEGLGEWLESCAIAVNDQMVSDLATSLNSGDRITLLPPVCGG